jgi:hypothetical protein
VLDEGECQGIFIKGDSADTARTLLLATNSLLPYSLSTQELGKRKEIDERVEKLAKVLLEGLIKR